MKRIYACLCIVAVLLSIAFYSSWRVQKFAEDISDDIDDAVEAIRAQVGSDRVILGLSGGVDSSVVAALCAYRDDLEQSKPDREPRVIPLYRSPAAAGYAAPVFGEDFDYLTVTEEVPQGAEFAVRIQGDSMSPYIRDGDLVYVNRDPLAAGDVGIFWIDGDILCKQYYKDPAGTVYLFSLNRARADADVVLTASSGRTLACFGRVIFRAPPLPGKG